MNKQILCYILVTVLLFTFNEVVYSQKDINYIKFKEDDPEYKKNRKEWLKEMHRCSPDINYQVINSETKKAKQSFYKEKYKDMVLDNKNKEHIQLDTFANGKIIGSWIEKGSNNQAGRVHTIDIDYENNTIYLASAGGNIWNGTLDGKNWICLNNSMQIKNIRMIRVIKIGNINRILVAGNGPAAVYYSDDYGQTWNKSLGLESPASWGGINRAVITNSEQPIIYVLGYEWDYKEWKSISFIYRSMDLGVTFESVTKLNLNSNFIDIWSSRYDNDKVFFVHRDTISSLSKDGTLNIISVAKTGIDTSTISQILLNGCYYQNEFYLYISLNKSGSDTTFFYASTNGGIDWELRGNLVHHPFEKNSFSVSTISPDVLYFGGVNASKSFDGGRNWNLVNNWWEYYGDIENKLHADIPSILSLRNPNEDNIENTYISTDGGLYLSKDSMNTVKNISLKDLNISQYYSTYTVSPIVSDSGALLAGSQDQGFQRCLFDSNSTLSFQQTISGDYGHLTSSDGGKTLWTVYPGFAMVYEDIAKSSTSSVNFWDFKGKQGLWLPPIVSVPDFPNQALVAAGGINNDEAHIWKLELRPEGILSLVFPFNFNNDKSNSKISAMSISPLDNKNLFVLTNNGKFFSSTNYGETWKKLDSFSAPSSHYFYGSNIELSNIDLNKLYIAGSGYSNPSIFVSYDRGKSFIPIDSGLPKTLIYDIAITPDEKLIFAATEVGPYIYVAEDNCWYDIAGLSAPDQTYWCVQWLPETQTARFGTYGRGIWDFKLKQFTSVFNENVFTNPNINLVVAPNPFVDKTNINVYSSKITTADLSIFDLAGRKVREVSKFNLNIGDNIIEWNGTSSSGYMLPTGNYIVVLRVADKIHFKSIKLIR